MRQVCFYAKMWTVIMLMFPNSWVTVHVRVLAAVLIEVIDLVSTIHKKIKELFVITGKE